MTGWFSATPLFTWSFSTALSVICFIISICILCRERRNRSKPDRMVTAKYLSAFSYLCIIMCPISTAVYIGTFLPPFCMFYEYLAPPLAYIQFAAMECYQLSRLYYCFSRNQVHSTRGYPNWMFITLIFVLSIWFVFANTLCFSWLTLECRIEGDGTAVSVGIYSFVSVTGNWHYAIITVQFLYALLESTTVSLYWYKVRSLRNYHDSEDRAVHDRIQCILHRVLILTYFYLIIAGILITFFESLTIADKLGLIQDQFKPFDVGSVCVLSVSYSMFLMQEHNTSEYVAFLHFIKRYKCIWCFCCFGSMVNEQYRMLVDNVDERKMKKMVSAPTFRDYASPTYNNNTTGMELSVATRTEVQIVAGG